MEWLKKLLISIFIMSPIFYSSLLYASVYEINGQVTWKDQPCREVTVFLVRDQKQGTKSFMDEFRELEQKNLEIKQLTDHEAFLKEKSDLMQKFRRLIKKYLAREKSANKRGQFYLNVSGSTSYYLIALKDPKQKKNNVEIIFWIEKVFFDPEADLSSKEFILNETNSTVW